MRAALSLLILTTGTLAAADVKRPNVVYIMADDLGWTDLACQGSKYYKTPNIDKLAAGGLRFTRGYGCDNSGNVSVRLPEDVLPPITAYYVMRVGRLPLLPYFAPGDRDLAEAVGRAAKTSRAVLLANHGPVISGTDLDSTVYAA